MSCQLSYRDDSTGRLLCKSQSGKLCGYQRMCTTQHDWVNTYRMADCVWREDMANNKSNNKKNITYKSEKTEEPINTNKKTDSVNTENDGQESNIEGKTKQCLKKFYNKGNLYFMFDNQCLKFPMDEKDSRKQMFTVTYSGDFGKGDFKIINIK